MKRPPRGWCSTKNCRPADAAARSLTGIQERLDPRDRTFILLRDRVATNETGRRAAGGRPPRGGLRWRCGGGGAEPGAPKGATLVLDFQPNAVHTGIYAAQANGYFRDEGVDLTIREPSASADSAKLLEAGPAPTSR